MKIKSFIKENKKIFIGILIGMLISSGSVYAASIISKDVSYDNSSSKLTSTNVQGAIDEVYKTATDKVAAAKKECPEGYKCTEIKKLCKAAEQLHDDNQNGDFIGSISSGSLKSGDAFDCDVNGDGVYNSETERFYYVSDYYNTDTREFESDTAVLIYYSNVSGGEPSYTDTFAYGSNENNLLPDVATLQLPSSGQWSNTKLKNNSRYILSINDNDNTDINIVDVFDYSDYSARLLNLEEVKSACNIASSDKVGNFGELDNCKFLMENTAYTDSSFKFKGYWLENTNSSYNGYVYTIFAFTSGQGVARQVSYSLTTDENQYGVRPAIEVSKDNISY